MKVVIVKDIEEMPEDCDSCPFQDFSQNCGILGEYTMLNQWMEDAPYYDLVGKGECPLRPLPSKDYWHKKDYADGWNDCIDVITGETK